jgi:hypothetical protein
MGWGTWGDVAADTGRDLEWARLLADGRRLYVDVAYYYGPLVPHLNAWLVRLFGAHLSVFVGAGLVVATLATAGLVAIVRPLAGWLAATVTGVAFVYCCAFAHLHYANVFNWVLPYLSASTYGMLFAIWSVERLLAYGRSERSRDFLLAALLLAAAALAKSEPGGVALVAHLGFVAVRGRRPTRAEWTGYAAAVVLVVAGYGIALRDDPLGLFRANFLDVAGHPAMRGFLAIHSGLADPAAAARAMATSAVLLGIALCLGRGAGILSDRGRATPPTAGVVGGAAAAVLYATASPAVPFAILPVIGLAAVGMLRAGAKADPARRSELVLWAAALACLARIPLAASGMHYGFYLLPLPLAAFVVWWFRAVPAWLGLGTHGARAHAFVGAAFLLAIAGRHLWDSRPLFAAHDVRADGPRGTTWLLGAVNGFPLGRAYADTIAFLRRYPASTRVLVVPTGAAMPFLAGLATAGDRTGFVPAELGPAAEERLLATLDSEPPDLIVSIRLDLREWGSRGFGVDYGRRTWSWMSRRYEPIATFGPEELVLVLGRRARASGTGAVTTTR